MLTRPMSAAEKFAALHKLKRSKSSKVYRGNCPRSGCDGVDSFTIRRKPDENGFFPSFCRVCEKSSLTIPL